MHTIFHVQMCVGTYLSLCRAPTKRQPRRAVGMLHEFMCMENHVCIVHVWPEREKERWGLLHVHGVHVGGTLRAYV